MCLTKYYVEFSKFETWLTLSRVWKFLNTDITLSLFEQQNAAKESIIKTLLYIDKKSVNCKYSLELDHFFFTLDPNLIYHLRFNNNHVLHTVFC